MAFMCWLVCICMDMNRSIWSRNCVGHAAKNLHVCRIYMYIYTYIYIYTCVCAFTRLSVWEWIEASGFVSAYGMLSKISTHVVYIYVCVRAHSCVCIFWCLCVCIWIEASWFVSSYGTLSKILYVWRIYTYICVCEFISLCSCIWLEASGPVQPIADVVAQNLEIFSKRCQYTTSLPTGFTISTRL